MNRIFANFEHYKYRYLAATLLIACMALFLLPTRPERISESNFFRIAEGMTQADVEEILGPGEDQTAHPERPGPGFIDGIGPHLPPAGVWKYWDGSEGTIAVRFVDDKVKDKNWRRAKSLWDRFKEELGW